MILSKHEKSIIEELIGEDAISFKLTLKGNKSSLQRGGAKLTKLVEYYHKDENGKEVGALNYYLMAEDEKIDLVEFFPIDLCFVANQIETKVNTATPYAKLNGWCIGEEQLRSITKDFEDLGTRLLATQR
jgi:hypothetical protein